MSTTTINPALSAPSGSEKISGRKLLWAAPMAGVIAAVVNTVLYFIYSAVGLNIILPIANPADPTQLTTPLMPIQVVLFSFFPALLAGVFLFALAKFTRRPITIFTIAAVIALILSFGMSLTMDIPVSYKVALDVMHIAAAAAIVGGLTRFARG